MDKMNGLKIKLTVIDEKLGMKYQKETYIEEEDRDATHPEVIVKARLDEATDMMLKIIKPTLKTPTR